DEVRAEVVGLRVVHQEDGGRVAARVQVAVHEPGRDELAPRVNRAVGLAVEAAAYVDDAVVLVDHHPVADQLVPLPIEPDDPAALYQRAHAPPPSASQPLLKCGFSAADRLAGWPPVRGDIRLV